MSDVMASAADTIRVLKKQINLIEACHGHLDTVRTAGALTVQQRRHLALAQSAQGGLCRLLSDEIERLTALAAVGSK